MAAKNAPVRIGELLAARYKVDRILKSGGMGVVVVASDVQLRRRVAIKFMLDTGANDGAANARFVREARAVSQLKSEHVVRVLDIGSLPDGAPYIVMELLDGSDLRDVLDERGPLPVEEAILFVLQACEGVAEAHAIGLVHRDIKPRNLFLARRVDGAPLVKVLDFGISKWTSPLPDDTNLALSQTAELVGTPQYMAPEQVLTPRDVDARADVWALGAVLYELLTAQMPFARSTTAELFRNILEGPAPSPANARPDLPPGLADAVTKCMMHAPSDRYSNVAELARALEPFGGRSARGWGERVASVLGVKPPSRTEAGEADTVLAATWGGTKGASTARRSRPRAWLAAPFVLAAAVGLYSIATRRAVSGSSSSSTEAHANAANATNGATDAKPANAASGAIDATPTTDAAIAANAPTGMTLAPASAASSLPASPASAASSAAAGARVAADVTAPRRAASAAPARPAPRPAATRDELPTEPH